MDCPVTFQGKSFLIQNIHDFGHAEMVQFTDSNPKLYGIALESFYSSKWRDHEDHVSAEAWLSQVPDDVVTLTQSGQCIILLDMSNEGPPFIKDHAEALDAALKRRKIKPGGCVLVQQNRRLPSDYQQWAHQSGAEPIRNLCYDYYPRRMVGLFARDGDSYRPYAGAREKRFLCLNFTPKPHRASLVSWLIGEGFSDLGFISFHTQNKNSAFAALQGLPDFPDAPSVSRGLAVLKAQAPLLLDLPPVAGNPDFSMVPNRYYDQSYFSIVTDSNIVSDVVRFTEKLIKPLAMFHPVILFGFPHALELLRSFGFKTFSEIFDESYDLIQCPLNRSEAVLRELRRVLNYSPRAMHDLYRSMEGKLVHNAAVARRLLNERYRSSLDEQLLRQIMGAP